jgi:hypothetical protein
MGAALLPAVAAAGGLLIVAGAFKAARPAATRAVLVAAGFRAAGPAVRLLGAAEIALGAALLLRPGRVDAALAAAAYACFALFVVRLLRRGADGVDCGCFGGAGGEASAFHLWLNVTLCAVCALAAAAPPPPLTWIAGLEPLTGVALLLGVAAIVYAAFLAFTLVPKAWGSYASEEAR